MSRKSAERAMEIGNDDPITLTEASEIVLRGVVSVSALRAEIARGNLVVERIGKNLFTTRSAIKEMRERCRVQQNRPASISARTGETGTEPTASYGPSGTGSTTDELAVLKATAKALKNGSLNTSQKSTPRGLRAVGDPIPFPSRKS